MAKPLGLNPHKIVGDICVLYATSKKVVHEILIDACDLPLLGDNRWGIKSNSSRRVPAYYVFRTSYAGGRKTNVCLHILIAGRHPGHCVDHINRDGRDNRRDNLRVVTPKQNSQNIYRTGNKHPGATFHKKTQKWAAQGCIDRKKHHIGLFETPEEAHAAYVAWKNVYHPFDEVFKEAA